MNIMKKLMAQARPVYEPTPQQAQDNALGLMHLRKLFMEFCHPKQSMSPAEQEDKLYNMLPLFCKVFGSSPSSEMEKFGDILQFCSYVSKLMVTEVRRRASNQSTEAASQAIVKFLEIENTEEASNGWMLLTTLNLLAAGNHSMVEVMVSVSVPSTLVKCLYLFFDLPSVVEEQKGEAPDSDFTPTERRILLQKVFSQVMVRLCSHEPPCEELARKDDLTLLFSAITSWCPPHNRPWRQAAAEVLMTLSRHGLTPMLVQYIHSKGCMAMCVDNMQRTQDLSPLEIVEMFVSVFCFLKDSSEVSQTLMDDFRQCQGYIFLSEFLLRLEQDRKQETADALRNLVLLVSSLSLCGYVELRPTQASTGSLYQMPGFSLPQPSGNGLSVRNIQAFQVLQSVFLKAQSTPLCCAILDAISSVYHSDSVNYFILEPQHTLSQFVEKIHLKAAEVQEKFFEMLEFIVFNLNFVPCKELISLSILIKTQQSAKCSILCMRTLLKVLRHNSIFKDVYREVGLLEVMVTCLHRYASLLKEQNNEGDSRVTDIPEDLKSLGFLVMDALTLLLSNNSSNASVFRECGGARCAHNMVPYVECRQQSLGIVQQLVMSSGGDDDMGTLLGLMHTAPQMCLDLKNHVLRSLLTVLRESHRTRTVFRKVGGFVYVMSVLISMEGCLATPPKSPWEHADRKEVLGLLKTVFNTLTVAMRFEPANAKFFATEICYSRLTDTVRLLGCFSSRIPTHSVEFLQEETHDTSVFEGIFLGARDAIEEARVPCDLVMACVIIRYLYDMALDSFDRSVYPSSQSPSPRRRPVSEFKVTSPQDAESPSNKRASTGTIGLPLLPTPPDPIVVHPGVILSILGLMNAVGNDTCTKEMLALQVYVSEILKSLVRSERNQQVACEVGLPHELLEHCGVALADESHLLHPALQYMFERLAAQSLDPRDLRTFLRMASPLNCVPMDEGSQPIGEGEKSNKTQPDTRERQKGGGGPVKLTRVKCLVSMTTPRDFRLHGASIMPGFVELDMSAEGFGCIFIPSLAPQSMNVPAVVGGGIVGASESNIIGGVGLGDRMFPSQNGFTYSSWLCVDKFSSPLQDPHPVRLLTLIRNMFGREEHLVCLNIHLSARDRAMFVSTAETVLPQQGDSASLADPPLSDDVVRFWCPELIQEGQWHHIVLVLNRAVLKNSSVSLYVDGQLLNTQKLHYISQNPGGGAANLTVASSVYGFIGTTPTQRRLSRLVWKQGPCHLLEEVMSNTTVQQMYKQGPNYVGSWQAPVINENELIGALVAEEKILLGLHSYAVCTMTIAKIRKIYNKIDSKAIAKQLGMSSHENATPIHVLRNSAGHLSGPARSLGGVLIGYLGVRTFCPKPVAKTLDNVGGASALLGLIAMAKDVEGLYAAVKALVCVVRSNRAAALDMDRARGYQILAMLFKKKRQFLNSHILHLTFSLVGTVDSGRESTTIPNVTAFEDLLCDLEVWHDAPCDLQRSLYEHFYDLVTESGSREFRTNLKLLRELGMVQKLLHILRDPSLSDATIKIIAMVLGTLLHNTPRVNDVQRFGQFVVSLLPPHSAIERHLNLEATNDESSTPDGSSDGAYVSARSIRLRNKLLLLVLSFIQPGNCQYMCDELAHSLGHDWVMLCMQPHLHHSTVVLGLRILILLLSNPAAMLKFRDGTACGGWLDDTEAVLQNRMGVVLGFNVGGGGNRPDNREVNREVCQTPGFYVLQSLLPKHTGTPEIYFLLMSFLLQQPAKDITKGELQFDLDNIWKFVFGVTCSQNVSMMAAKADVCPEAAMVILSMVRNMLNQESKIDECAWLLDYPITIIQFMLFLYHHVPAFTQVAMSADFLCSLASTLFPYKASSEGNSEVITPTEEYKVDPLSEGLLIVRTCEGPNGASNLTAHPARKFVIDLMRVIVIDSLSLPPAVKGTPVLDYLLEAAPELSTRSQQREFQTALLSILMDHLLAADALLGEQAALPIAQGGSHTHLASNVFYFATRVVDKLWQGVFHRDPAEVFDFILKLITQAKRRSLSGIAMDGIYHCLNRVILYQLSRPSSTVTEQMNLLEALHKLTSNRTLIFGPGNYESEFIGCLVYCLIQICEEEQISSCSSRQTTWHVDPMEITAEVFQSVPAKTPDPSDGHALLVTAARRVWEGLYACKKPVIEDVFKVSLNMEAGSIRGQSAPDLMSIQPLVSDAANKLWLFYVENERKALIGEPIQLTSQLQSMSSKLVRMGSGMTRLVRGRQRRDFPIRIFNTSLQDYNMCTYTHVSIVRDLVDMRHKQYQQSQEHMQQYVLDEWTQMETDLTRERGLWGPPIGSVLDKWMLDITEGPCRMRKKLMANDKFFLLYPHRHDHDAVDVPASTRKYKHPVSYDSRLYAERCYKQMMFEREEQSVFPVQSTDSSSACLEMEKFEEIGQKTARLLTSSQTPKRADNEDDDIDAATDASSEVHLLSPESGPADSSNGSHTTEVSQEEQHGQQSNNPDNQTLLRLLDEGEKIRHMFRCARIEGLDTYEGLLLFGQGHWYIVDGFTLLRSHEIREIDCIPAELHDPIIPMKAHCPSSSKSHSKFTYEDIREVCKRRYLLQPTALEVFSVDGRNQLLVFPRKVRNKVYERFMSVATSITDSAHQSVSGQKRNATVEPGTGLLSSLIGEKSVTQRWERGEISNFQYLMHVNTLAGRSYNDLMQYPVFPWILADYDSEELDLNSPATFRDLSKPMGAQSPERLQQFKKRFVEWDDPHSETPPYHYGTHYSSAMIIASYLVRMEPFTQHFLRLQGGHFDLADRMYHSVKEAWLSSSKHNMADVKELIPEFFYLPDFLTNSNNFDLGVKQSGVVLSDVVLPKWAKNDSSEFIRVHRQALECDYVSAHLHEWIDLIFGYKQQGSAAMEASNVFHHLFYEGAVDVYNITDPLQKSAIIGFINNFGQIPKQLFRKPHPAKKVSRSFPDRAMDVSPAVTVSSDRLFFHNLDILKPSMQPVKELRGAVGHIVHSDKTVLAVEQNKALIPPVYNHYIAWGYADMSIREGVYGSDKASHAYELYYTGEVLCAACPNSRLVITGHTSSVVRVWEVAKAQGKKQLMLKRSLYGHTEAVTCVAASLAYNVIVSGSRDQTCIMWDMNRLLFIRQLCDHGAPVACVSINELTGDIATCAGPHLNLWNINGQKIADVNTATGRNQQILCVAMSQVMEWDPENVIMTGSSDGVVRMWMVEFVQVPDENSRHRSASQNTLTSDASITADEDSEREPAISLSSGTRLRTSVSADSLCSDKDICTAHTTSHDIDIGQQADSVDITQDAGDRGQRVSEEGSVMRPQASTTNNVEALMRPVVQTIVDGAPVGLTMGSACSTAIDSTVAVVPCVTESKLGEKSLTMHKSVSTGSDDKAKGGLDRPKLGKTDPSILSRATSRNRNTLREGFMWQRQLVFRSKLTMHTAFDRKDNTEPAAITAIAVSRDHKTVYVGDTRGRVYSWSVTDQPGRVMADHWVKDEGVDGCIGCGTKFSFSERRHHCRNCGQLFCSRCSRFESEISRLRIMKPVRVCQPCYSSLRAAQHGTVGDGST
ncbi:PREDICTED: WD repeat and FYVE domain-containing protein 3-like isoform X2 [Priapulus caudatus]|uniref:WD repeat and FYVE domain-containing protein 3-like isoform X2 n=1 Tax=Priapulus caudatus TaxID=37621 RepID=A0ABM1FB39_PRICU|nr:PREDICTED: WD repeat and FYVE domain-containing protein 3-like isoform X2 [Priapulus caudatus]